MKRVSQQFPGVPSHFIEAITKAGAVELIPLAEIYPNPKQPRRYFSRASLEELTASIKDKGLLSPLLLRPRASGGFDLVAGERRFRSATAAGMTEVPAVVRELTDLEVARISFIENFHRDDLTPYEETIYVMNLLAEELNTSHERVVQLLQRMRNEDNRLVQRQVLDSPEGKAVVALFAELGRESKRFGWKGFAGNRLVLLKYPAEIQAGWQAGWLSWEAGKAVAGLPDQRLRQKLLEQLERGESEEVVLAQIPRNAPAKPNLTFKKVRLAKAALERFETLAKPKQDKVRDLLRQVDELLE